MSSTTAHLVKPPKSLLRQVGRAIADFRMIGDGDRILLGVSGGKDSLSLLHVLAHLRTYAPVRFELAALTVDPEVPGFDPQPLKDYYTRLGVPWHYEQQPLMEQAKTHMDGDSFCAYCSRMKRGIMYRLCREHGYNVLALGQHLDDLAESLMMSLFHGGQLRTMKAHYRNQEGDLRVIRPLAYCRERQTADFAAHAGLPVVPDSCPACFTMPSQRAYMKTLLAREEREHQGLFANMLHAMRPIMTEGELPEPGWPSDRPRPDSEQAALGEGDALAGADDEVIEHAHVDQRQGSAQPLGDA
ncbi:tRNA 2-thiocytidine biosynthesis protein TtcA [Marichromatium gracile]|uniref:ATP-binding protein n=1 Tax=Marichromatium gracile TaxID=1048 RepID=UPI001F3C10A7|nr:ATP-binding protein [Marichromatium gracile]MCF1182511.1 tRNA 2-thiocytidine biosynthesis protein TtcA [Marichromatium gracile]